jgi:hypothetical protein
MDTTNNISIELLINTGEIILYRVFFDCAVFNECAEISVWLEMVVLNYLHDG